MHLISESHVRAHLVKELPRSCMALLRTSMCKETWLSQLSPLRYDMTNISEKGVRELPISDILQSVSGAPAGSRIFLFGEGGSGKSTTVNYLCTKWNERSGLTKRFPHAYLLPVRKIVSPYAFLEHIICQDLEIIPQENQQDVRRFIKFNSASIIWFVDGYDERAEHGKEETTIDKLISGENAPYSTVVITSRPQDANILSAIKIKRRLEVYVKGFDDSAVKHYLERLPKSWAPTYAYLVQNNAIPRELLKSPLFLAMVCYIHQERSNQRKRRKFELVSTCAVLDAVCGIFLGIKEEKTPRRNFPHYTGYRDDRLSPKMKGLIRKITKLAFDSTKIGNFDLHIKKLHENDVYKEDLKNIGFLNGENSKYSFIHPLFQEHAAAYHMADNEADLEQVLLALVEKPGLMTTRLGVFSNPLLFAVGLKSNVLTLTGEAEKELSIVRVIQENGSDFNNNNLDLELSYQSRLFHECHDSNTREAYLNKMKNYRLPSEPVTLSYQPQIQASAYITLVDALGKDGCLHLLNKVHQKAMIMNGRHASLSPPEGCSTRYITDTVLISCLPIIDLIRTQKLVIQNCSLHVLAHTAKIWKVIIMFYIFSITCWHNYKSLIEFS